MGRVCESNPLKAGPPKRELVDIVGPDIGHYEANIYEEITPILVERERAAQADCYDDSPIDKVRQYTDPCPPPYDDRYRPNRVCDCPAEEKRTTYVCDLIGQRTMGDYYCIEDNLFDAAASNYFKHAEPLVQKTKCRYPFPCKAHCFEPPPPRNPLADSPVPHPSQVNGPRHYQYSMRSTPGDMEACGSGRKRNGLDEQQPNVVPIAQYWVESSPDQKTGRGVRQSMGSTPADIDPCGSGRRNGLVPTVPVLPINQYSMGSTPADSGRRNGLGPTVPINQYSMGSPYTQPSSPIHYQYTGQKEMYAQGQ
ncbi:hypothetical protein WDU94_005958 [Cyamophila willieti]